MSGDAASVDGLLWSGVVATVVFLGVLLVEGARRPGYDPSYHTGSELELGPGAWRQRSAFLLMGVGMAAYAVGVHRVLDAPVAAGLLAVFAAGNVVAAVFTPDPVRGYPPGAPGESPRRSLSWQAQVHDVAGPVMFLALLGACLALVRRLDGGWAAYTLATGLAGLVLTVATARAYGRDAAHTGAVQRALVGTSYLWLVLLGIHLASR